MGGFECGPPAPIFRTPCNFYEHVRQTCYENHLQTARKKLNFSFTKKKRSTINVFNFFILLGKWLMSKL